MRCLPGISLIATLRNKAKNRKFRRGIFNTVLIAAACYLLLEISYSALIINRWIDRSDPYYICEESGKTIHFDPIAGYRLTTIPSRAAKITRGTIEFHSVFHGNAQGFPDPDDFSAGRRTKALRFAVLGDSFTAAEYLETDWTTRVEHLAQQAGTPVEMLNFSLSGTGLGNWWSIVTGKIKAENYQLDGLVFAVFEGNLHRTFSVSDHRSVRYHHFGRASSWKPDTWPKTLEQAKMVLQPLRGLILDREEYQRALAGDIPAFDPPPSWRPYAAIEIGELFKNAGRWLENTEDPPESMPQVPALETGQLRLISDIADYAKTADLPVLVISIPSRPTLLTGAPHPADVVQFAGLLQGQFVDGAKAFAGRSAQEIRARWLPYDGHWGQRGSDEFAKFAWTAIRQWRQID